MSKKHYIKDTCHILLGKNKNKYLCVAVCSFASILIGACQTRSEKIPADSTVLSYFFKQYDDFLKSYEQFQGVKKEDEIYTFEFPFNYDYDSQYKIDGVFFKHENQAEVNGVKKLYFKTLNYQLIYEKKLMLNINFLKKIDFDKNSLYWQPIKVYSDLELKNINFKIYNSYKLIDKNGFEITNVECNPYFGSIDDALAKILKIVQQ